MNTSRKSILDYHEIQVYQELGFGRKGGVHLIRFKELGLVVARKVIKDEYFLANVPRLLRDEISLHRRLSHKNIIQLVGFELKDDCTILYLEYAPFGDLLNYINDITDATSIMDDKLAASFTRDILSGLKYLDSKEVLHRDIKSENVLVCMNRVAKIADFGLSC